MPWKMGDAPRHTKKAASPKAKSQWASTANAVLADSGDEAKAIRIANAAVKKAKGRAKVPKTSSPKKDLSDADDS